MEEVQVSGKIHFASGAETQITTIFLSLEVKTEQERKDVICILRTFSSLALKYAANTLTTVNTIFTIYHTSDTIFKFKDNVLLYVSG